MYTYAVETYGKSALVYKGVKGVRWRPSGTAHKTLILKHLRVSEA